MLLILVYQHLRVLKVMLNQAQSGTPELDPVRSATIYRAFNVAALNGVCVLVTRLSIDRWFIGRSV